MNLEQIYTRLANVPLFKGVSGEDLFMILDKVPMHWYRLREGQRLLDYDETCKGLIFLLEGDLTRTRNFDEKTYTITDVIRGPMIIEVEQLYGLTCRYTARYEARTDCLMMSIEKNDIRRTLLNIPLWRTNLLNLMASQIVKMRQFDIPQPNTLAEKIMHFGLDHQSVTEEGHTLRIRQLDLGRYLCATRRTISMELHKLVDQGLVEMHPNKIIVHSEVNKL